MGNLLKKCRRKNDDPEVEERRLAISRTIASRIAATAGTASRIAATAGTLPLQRRHLTAAIETFIAGKRFIDNYWFLI